MPLPLCPMSYIAIHVTRTASPKKKKQKKPATTPTEVNEEQLFDVIYQFFLNFKIPNRIPVKSDQGTWLSKDPSTYMRDKARAVIKTKAESFNLLLTTHWPAFHGA